MTDAANFKLIIEDDEGRRSVVPVDLGEVSIGRLDGNTIRLNERNVSRRHARLFRDTANVVAEDLDSYNGVFVNGERIKGRQEIKNGDVIRIGDFQLELRGEGLVSRAEETTQRTQVPEIEATQPDIRLSPTGVPHKLPSKPTPAVEEPVAEPKPREEPTAIIRMSHLEDVEASRRDVKAAISGQKAKIVCVSTQYAGRQFEITKTEVVIGRTDDNDIAIDHRSVSRHHAKIVTAGKSVKLVDLKSANGTLVNGEEYAQTELKNGDLIELGHVKFRFVPPGETYNFTAEEVAAMQHPQAETATGPTLPDGSPGRATTHAPRALKPNQLVLGAIAGLGVIIVGLVAWLVMSSSDKGKPNVVEAVTPPAATVAITSSPVVGGTEADKLVARAVDALSQRNWQQGMALAQAALALDPMHGQAQEVVRKANLEVKAQASYDLAVSAINSAQWSQAWSQLREIPDSSIYAPQRDPLTRQVQAALVTEKIQAAETAIQAGDCGRAEESIDEIAALEPARPDVARLRSDLDSCRAASASASVDRSKRTPRPTPAAKVTSSPAKASPTPPPAEAPPTPAPAASSGGGDPKAFYADGAKALGKGEYQKAIDKFSECVKADKKFCLCYRAMGITYAKAGNGPKAYRYYKQYLKVCPDATDAAAVEELLKKYESMQ